MKTETFWITLPHVQVCSDPYWLETTWFASLESAKLCFEEVGYDHELWGIYQVTVTAEKDGAE